MIIGAIIKEGAFLKVCITENIPYYFISGAVVSTLHVFDLGNFLTRTVHVLRQEQGSNFHVKDQSLITDFNNYCIRVWKF